MEKKNQYQKVDGGKGILPRSKLPQIPKKQIPKFVRELQSRGVEVRARYIPAKDIIPLQANVDKDKLRHMQTDLGKFEKDVFLVSKENRLLDGHHRWLILKGSNKDRPIRTIQVNLPMARLIKIARKFDGAHHEEIV